MKDISIWHWTSSVGYAFLGTTVGSLEITFITPKLCMGDGSLGGSQGFRIVPFHSHNLFFISTEAMHPLFYSLSGFTGRLWELRRTHPMPPDTGSWALAGLPVSDLYVLLVCTFLFLSALDILQGFSPFRAN